MIDISAEIKELKTRLAELEKMYEAENSSSAPRKFSITFLYETTEDLWDPAVLGDLDEAKVTSHIEMHLGSIAEELYFDEEGEKFTLVEVRELSTNTPETPN